MMGEETQEIKMLPRQQEDMEPSDRRCDARKDECGVGHECRDGMCTESRTQVRVGNPCVTDAQCESNACVALAADVAAAVGLAVVPRVCDVVNSRTKVRGSDFA